MAGVPKNIILGGQYGERLPSPLQGSPPHARERAAAAGSGGQRRQQRGTRASCVERVRAGPASHSAPQPSRLTAPGLPRAGGWKPPPRAEAPAEAAQATGKRQYTSDSCSVSSTSSDESGGEEAARRKKRKTERREKVRVHPGVPDPAPSRLSSACRRPFSQPHGCTRKSRGVHRSGARMTARRRNTRRSTTRRSTRRCGAPCSPSATFSSLGHVSAGVCSPCSLQHAAMSRMLQHTLRAGRCRSTSGARRRQARRTTPGRRPDWEAGGRCRRWSR